MEDGQQQDLPCLGTLRAVKGLPCRTLTLRKRVIIPGAGRYRKELAAPFYRVSAVRKYRREQPEDQRLPLLGAVGRRGAPRNGSGYVQRQEGAHCFRLAVSPLDQLSGLGWSVKGYLAADSGWVAVVRRRVAYWVLLAIVAVVVFGVSYQAFRYGWQEGTRMLLESLRELPDTLLTAWYRFWHQVL